MSDILMECTPTDKPNKNGRVYSYKSLKNAVEAYNELFVKSKTSFGEIGASDKEINIQHVSHLITDNLTLHKNGTIETRYTHNYRTPTPH